MRKNVGGRIVLIVLLIGFGFLVWRVSRYAAQYRDEVQFKNVGYALARYELDHRDTLPPLTDAAVLEQLLTPYCSHDSHDVDNDVQLNPMLGRPGSNVRYLPNTLLSSKKLETITNPSEVVVLYEERSVDGNRLIGYVDAHCRSVTESEWITIKQKSGIK